MGTWQFDEYPTYDEWIKWFDLDVKRPDMGKLGEYHERRHLPVWAAGNAYLAGAKAWKHESDKMESEDKPFIELVEKDGQYFVKTNLFDVLGDYASGVVNSDILGYAFEPEQRFESPDGSAITAACAPCPAPLPRRKASRRRSGKSSRLQRPLKRGRFFSTVLTIMWITLPDFLPQKGEGVRRINSEQYPYTAFFKVLTTDA